MESKKSENRNELPKQEDLPEGIDLEMLEISGSLEQYHKDMRRLAKNFQKDVKRLKKTKSGRRKLREAGFNVKV